MAKKNDSMHVCLVADWIAAVLLLIATLASLAGVWNTHMVDGGPSFGTTAASLALIAFGVNLTLCVKKAKCLCGTCEIQ